MRAARGGPAALPALGRTALAAVALAVLLAYATPTVEAAVAPAPPPAPAPAPGPGTAGAPGATQPPGPAALPGAGQPAPGPAAGGQGGNTSGLGIESLIPAPDGIRSCGTPTQAERYPSGAYSLDAQPGTFDVAEPVLNAVAGALFALTVIFSVIFSRLVMWAFNFEIFSQNGVGNSTDQVVRSLNGHLYQPLLGIVVALAGGWLVWHGLIRRRLTVTLESITWMVVAMAVAGVFMAIPSQVMSEVDGIAVTTSKALLGAVSDADPATQSAQFSCDKDPGTAGLRLFVDRFWTVNVYAPYAVLELGSLQHAETPSADGEIHDARVDAILADHMQGKSSGDTLDDLKAKGLMPQSDDSPANSWFNGHASGSRIAIAVLSLLTVLAFGLLLLFAVGSILVAQLGLVLMAMGAPLFFVVAVYPGGGRDVFFKWLRTLLEAMAARVLWSGLLAIVMTLAGVVVAGIVTGTGSTLLASLLEILIVVVAFIYRKTWFSIYTAIGNPQKQAQAWSKLKGAHMDQVFGVTSEATPGRRFGGLFGTYGKLTQEGNYRRHMRQAAGGAALAIGGTSMVASTALGSAGRLLGAAHNAGMGRRPGPLPPEPRRQRQGRGPGPGGGPPPNGPPPDSGGPPPPDSNGPPPPDSGGSPPPDSGGTPLPDSGGTPPPDSGGTPLPDSGGTPPPDSGGTPPPDSGDTPPPHTAGRPPRAPNWYARTVYAAAWPGDWAAQRARETIDRLREPVGNVWNSTPARVARGVARTSGWAWRAAQSSNPSSWGPLRKFRNEGDLGEAMARWGLAKLFPSAADPMAGGGIAQRVFPGGFDAHRKRASGVSSGARQRRAEEAEARRRARQQRRAEREAWRATRP